MNKKPKLVQLNIRKMIEFQTVLSGAFTNTALCLQYVMHGRCYLRLEAYIGSFAQGYLQFLLNAMSTVYTKPIGNIINQFNISVHYSSVTSTRYEVSNLSK